MARFYSNILKVYLSKLEDIAPCMGLLVENKLTSLLQEDLEHFP